MIWPENKKFAFTIIDDTDCATIDNIKPVYDYLYSKGMLTTKTVWVHASRDGFLGQHLEDDAYKKYVLSLQEKGFEIALHGVGSGKFSREEILLSMNIFKETLGYFPRIFINHNENSDCIYWGKQRFSPLFGFFYNIARKIQKKRKVESGGSDNESSSFWGDFCKRNVEYIRNYTFNGINTLKYDNKMPYRVSRKAAYSNYWFSSSDGKNIEKFCKLLKKEKIDHLVSENGLCIVYTHFAYGFCVNGELDTRFIEIVDYLAGLDGYYAPVGQILDYLRTQREKDNLLNAIQESTYDFRWLIDRTINEIRGKLK